MKKLLIFLFIAITSHVQAQQFYNSLFGFRLGQYREATRTELGTPFKSDKFEDGYQYDAFLLKPDTSLYIAFEYAANDTNVIWSIQVTGSETTTDIGFKNIKLGLGKSQAEKLLGKPSSIEDTHGYGWLWEYAKTNFSIEIGTKGKLSSIKISDRTNELYPKGPDIKKIPTFEKIRQTLTAGSNAEILNLLAGDIEIYYNDKTWFFRKPFRAEQTTDYSGLLAIIKTISKDLATVNTKNGDEYEENMRLTYGENIKHVIKIKKGHLIKEIVLKFVGGQYYIYEINANSK